MYFYLLVIYTQINKMKIQSLFKKYLRKNNLFIALIVMLIIGLIVVISLASGYHINNKEKMTTINDVNNNSKTSEIFQDWIQDALCSNPITWDNQNSSNYDDHKGFLYLNKKVFPKSVKIESIDIRAANPSINDDMLKNLIGF